MIKKIVVVVLLVWCYNHPDKLSDGMVKTAIGFKAGVEASHKGYEVKRVDNQEVVYQPKSKMLLPGPDGLIDPWPEN